MLVFKNTKICVTPPRSLKLALPPMQTPNASRWNIGRVGSPKQKLCVGHVDFMLFVLIFHSCWGPVCSGIWAIENAFDQSKTCLKIMVTIINKVHFVPQQCRVYAMHYVYLQKCANTVYVGRVLGELK